MSSTGSQMRRQNEILLQQHIDDFMEEAKSHIQQSKIIFLYAPGMNKLMFTAKSGHLSDYQNKVKAVIFPSQKANATDAVELVSKITQVTWILPGINQKETTKQIIEAESID